MRDYEWDYEINRKRPTYLVVFPFGLGVLLGIGSFGDHIYEFRCLILERLDVFRYYFGKAGYKWRKHQ